MNLKSAGTNDLKTRDLWLVRIYFFLVYAGSAFLRPFISLFFVRQGLIGAQIGVLGTIGAATQLIAAPLWGRASDRTSTPRRLLQIALIGSALMMLTLSQQSRLLWMAVIISIDALLVSGLLPLSDTLALGVSKKNNYGSIRLWGSLGWASIVLLAGWLIQRSGIFSAFAGYAFILVICALFLLLISPGTVRKGQTQHEQTTPQGLSALRDELLKNPTIMWMTAALAVAILFRIGIASFEPIYLDQLGAPETVIGLGATIAALVELPAMLWADRLNTRIGPRRLFMAANGIYIVMMGAVLLAPSITTIILTKIAAGFAFSFFTVALVMFVREAVPDEQRSTGLALFMVTIPALVSIAGNPLNGYLFDLFGAYWLYAFAAAGYTASLLILGLAVPRMR